MTEISYLALGSSGNPDYGLLAQRVNDLFSSLRSHVTTKWKDAGSTEKTRLARISGCLEKLSSFLMQASRMRKYHDSLIDMAQKFNQFGDAPLPFAFWIAQHGREACSDFEGTLLQARAALDRLARFIAAELKQTCSSFTRLEGILSGSREDLAKTILKIIREAEYLKMSLIAPGNPDPLRDFVAHKGAAWEIMSGCFAVYFLGRNQVLICDCELGDTTAHLAVLKTSQRLCSEIPFVVLNTLATICGIETVAREDFAPNWQLVTAVLSEYVTQEPTGIRFNVIKTMTPSGFESQMQMLDRGVLKYLMQVPPGPSQFTFDMGNPQ
jgi:hypothetical protein